ncbi:hypothetical protein [Streptomyces sp. NPDC049881]|uniref:hypothetical protein n=1 Tax=unclassified Streptomyces TaxID=2593676 RepID=UPI00341AF77F
MAEIEQMTTALRALESAVRLLGEEQQRLDELHGRPAAYDRSAGGPQQTLTGIRELHSAAARAAEALARAVGYRAAGLDRAAARAEEQASARPAGLPGGVDRMARPLGERTVEALALIRDLSWFGPEVGVEIDVCLAAPQATYPPDDWDAYQRARAWQRGRR